MPPARLAQLAVSRPPGDQVLQVRHWFFKAEFGNQRVHPISPYRSIEHLDRAWDIAMSLRRSTRTTPLGA